MVKNQEKGTPTAHKSKDGVVTVNRVVSSVGWVRTNRRISPISVLSLTHHHIKLYIIFTTNKSTLHITVVAVLQHIN